MIELNTEEKELAEKFSELKNQAGSHSPSIFTFKQKLPELNIAIDACFLSNPYATDLFLEYFTREVMNTGKIRELLEFYPSQNQVIAELLGEFLKVDARKIFVGNGAIEVIQAVIHNFTRKKILINIPTFSSYYEFAKDSVQVVYNTLRKEENYQLNPAVFIAKVKEEHPDTVVIINPNNPDGGYIPFSVLQEILEGLSDIETVVIDESFIHFAYEGASLEPVSAVSLAEKFNNLVIIKSMSKDFGIAGVRAGYGIMSKQRVDALVKNGYLWNSNGLSEYFFRLYARPDFATDYEQVRKKYIAETITFIQELSKLKGIKVLPSKANFVLVEILGNISSMDFVTALLIKYGIYVRTANDKIGLQGQYIRVASRTKEENEFMIASFGKLLS
ncbi:MAG: histidinol-phosphate aminotransferase family protein [Chitinophagales bacterium]|nr:histidinol-phosphate aminotransferase family protein [Chitinophagales bacterium]